MANISDSKMQGNVYNKLDADTWLIRPRFEDVKRTSLLDVNELVFYDDDSSDDPALDPNISSDGKIDICKAFGKNK